MHRLKWQEQDRSLEDARPLSPVPLPEVMFPGQTPSWRAAVRIPNTLQGERGERRVGLIMIYSTYALVYMVSVDSYIALHIVDIMG